MSDGRHHCLILIDAFLCFNQVYPVKSTDATRTIHAMSTFINFFGIPQKLVYDKETSFFRTDFSTLPQTIGITYDARTKWSPWIIGKAEIQNKYLNR